MKLRNKRTGQEGNFIINKDHFECTDLEYVPEYRSLAELNEEWEDYKPAEPLIKDEKIRKAVRAWADMQGSCWITKETDQCCRDSLGYFFNSSKEIFGDLELGIEYTIAELCGEDEE